MTKARNIADLGSNDVIETTATGVDVTGTVTADGLNVGDIAANNYSGLSGLSNMGVENADVYGYSAAEGGLVVNAKYESGWKHTQSDVATRYTQVNGDHRFYSADSGVSGATANFREVLKLDNTGDVSFYEDTGTTAKFVWDSSAERLDLSGAVGSQLRLNARSGSGTYWEFDSLYGGTNPELRIKNNSLTAVTLDSSGNVGIGTSPSTKLHLSHKNQGSTAGTIRIQDTDAQQDAGQQTGGIEFYTQDASIPTSGVSSAIKSFVSSSQGGAYLTFGTASNNTSTQTERMRLDSSGNLLVGTTAMVASLDAGVSAGNSVCLGSGSPWSWFTGNSDSGSYVQYIQSIGTSIHELVYFATSTSNVGSITSNGSSTNYNTTSDERLKENIQDTTHTVDINDIRVREFDWKVNGEHQRFGFIAQELETVYPEAVHSPYDPEEMKSVDYSKLVPLLVKEIQTLKARIETLENN